jgi:hypothetical protein
MSTANWRFSELYEPSLPKLAMRFNYKLFRNQDSRREREREREFPCPVQN